MKIAALNLTLSAAVIGFGSAFIMVSHHQQRMMDSTVVLKDRHRLSDIDLMAIENVAELCLNVETMIEECDLEEWNREWDVIQRENGISKLIPLFVSLGAGPFLCWHPP